uniref:CHK domain-containing protein n=1 Tax=Steinernema glaseri TaxID=37863 RepID=A0A1I7ZH61_9BILA
MAEKQFFDPYLTQLKESQPGMFDEGIDILCKFTRQKKFFRYTLRDIYKDVGLPIGFSHGDFSNNNFLWKTNPDGSFANELAAIIDWQTMHEGCLTNDLARFMAMGVNGEARRAHEDEILQCYYDTLRKILEKRGQRADFTLDQV